MQGDGDKAGEWLSMLNPIRHSDSPNGTHRYKVEPYVICADVYSEAPHVGRGGWTWYTGSAGWMYRVALERLLGFRVQGDHLILDPCIPRSWPGVQISYRHGSAFYEIRVENPDQVNRGVVAIKLDGAPLGGQPRGAGQGLLIPLSDDGAAHAIDVVMGTEM
jgi:cyclic beta-1,2-glucan synthetase